MQCRGRVEDGADAEHGSSCRSARKLERVGSSHTRQCERSAGDAPLVLKSWYGINSLSPLPHVSTTPLPHTSNTSASNTHTRHGIRFIGPLCNAVLWYTTVCASPTAEKHLLSREQNMLPGGHGHGVYMQHDTRTDHFPVERRCRRLWFQWLSALSTLLTYCAAGCAEMLIGIVASRPDD